MKTQTIVSLPKLQIMLASPMSSIPNDEGFRLLGIMPSKLAIGLTVQKDSNGCHYLADQHNSHRLPSAFIGWIKDESVLK